MRYSLKILPSVFFFATLLSTTYASGQTTEVGPAAPGTLRVETVPPGQTVYIAQSDFDAATELGTTPLEKQLPEGAYIISIESEGYQPAVAEVSIKSGEVSNVKIPLVPIERRQEMQRVFGHVFIWPGIVFTIAGIAMIEADAWGTVGRVGLAGAGLGVALTISGGILLGISHRTKLRYAPPVAFAPLPGGGALSFGKTF